MADDAAGTEGSDYTRRLVRRSEATWKRLVDAQAPYRWNVRRLDLGLVLDVGCGIGRNLHHLDGNGVGVDHNPTSVEVARRAGLTAYTVEEFQRSPHAVEGRFDSLLAAHVVEHLSADAAVGVLRDYLPYVRRGGKAVIITPQERGHASDSTHVRFCDFGVVRRLLGDVGVEVERTYSFPFPRAAGRLFRHNEFVTVGLVA